FKVMSFRVPAVTASQYLRLRGTNLPPSVPFETDSNGNPLPDLWTNPAAVNPTVPPTAGPPPTPGSQDGVAANANLKIICRPVGSHVPDNASVYTGQSIDGCPNHLPVISGMKFVAYDVAAWSDLWFYSNPIFIEVKGSTVVAGVK